MLRKTISKSSPLMTLALCNSFAHDWSHIYDGILRFEDNSLGSLTLAIREQALTFAKTKLSPFAW